MIDLIVLDVDGCLTDGKIVYGIDKDETKAFSVKDGLGVTSWVRMGKKVAIITGRKSTIVQRRAKELGVHHIHQGEKNKLERLKAIVKSENISLANVAAIGDDLNDLQMLQAVGKSYCPKDASKYITQVVHNVCSSRGGEGAVREMIEDIVINDGLESEFVALWQ